MTLLQLEHVHKRRGTRIVLDDVSLLIEPGELVVVWGERRSGRSTLLRLSAGIETPEAGTVRFAGRDLAGQESEMLGNGISYCRKVFRPSAGHTVLEHLIAGQLARRTPRAAGLSRAWRALERVGVEQCARLKPTEMNTAEIVRVAIARGLAADPRFIVIDEPTIGVDLLERDGILSLLRSLADDGIAILSSTGEGTGVLGADRVLSLGKGKLLGETTAPDLAPVTDIGRRRHTG